MKNGIQDLKFFILLFIFFHLSAIAQQEPSKKSMEIYGYIMLDFGYNFGAVDPQWQDVLRPTKILDSEGNEFEPKGNVYMSVRQTRVGLKNYLVTSLGELKTHFEFDMFGNGVDAGQTTFHLRHAYAEMGKFGIGQTNSVFADGDIFPNTIEFFGPNGMVMFRNIQIRYMPIQKENTKLTIALERPGESVDEGQYGAGFEYPGAGGDILDGIAFRFPTPDLTAEYRKVGKWGYLELAGILRNIKWEDNKNDQYDLSGSAIGWGLNLTTNLKLQDKITFKGALVYGEGIQNYMNDADADLGIKKQYNNTRTPITGEPISMLSFVGFVDINWNEKFSSSLGYSRLDNNTSDSQLSTAYKSGQYAVGNLLYYPVKNCMMGVELQYGHRQNNDFKGDPTFGLVAENGNSGSVVKVQFSFKYKFDETFYRKQ
jgi:hypothetical protein